MSKNIFFRIIDILFKRKKFLKIVFSIYLIIISFFLISKISKAEIKEFEGWIYNGESITIDNIKYNAYLDESKEYALFISEINGKTDIITVKKENCETNEIIKICFNETNYDRQYKDYKLYFYIYRFETDIKLERKIDKNIVYIGDEANFEVKIKNNGNNEVEVEYIDELPDSLEISSYNNAEKKQNKIYWNGLLKSNEEYKIKYKVLFKEIIDYYSKSLIKYHEGDKKKEVFSDAIRLYSMPIFEVNLSLSKNEFLTNEPIFLNISLSKKTKKDIDYNLELFFPEIDNENYNNIKIIDNNIELFNLTNSNKNILVAKLNENLKNNKSYYINYSQNKLGKYYVFLRGNYTYNDIFYKIDEQKINYEITDNEPELTLISNKETLNTYEKDWLIFRIKNKNPYSKIYVKNLSLDIKDNIIEELENNYNKYDNTNNIEDNTKEELKSELKYYIEKIKQYYLNHFNFNIKDIKEIEKNQTEVFLNQEIIIPNIQDFNFFDYNKGLSNKALNNLNEIKLKKLILIFNFTYYSEDNMLKSKIIKKIINVEEIEKLKLITNFKDSGYENEEILFSIKVKNPTNLEIKDSKIQTLIPENFKVFGITSTSFFINKSEEKNIINFKLIPERVNEITRYNIIFILNYTLGLVNSEFNKTRTSYSIIEQKTLTIMPKIPEVSIKKSLDRSSFIGEIMQVEYEIESIDSIIYNLSIMPLENENFDFCYVNENKETIQNIKDNYEKNKEFYESLQNNKIKVISKLNPGEKIKIKGEKIIPKKMGAIETGKTILFFYDEYNREFNITSVSLNIDIKDNEIKRPLIIIEKKTSKEISKEDVFVNEPIEMIINFTNIGQNNVMGYVNYEGNVNILNDNYFSIPFYSTKLINRSLEFNKEGNYKIPRAEFLYEYKDCVQKAYSNEIEIKVKDNEKNLDENNKDKNFNDVKNKLEIEKNKDEKNNESKNKETFFVKFMNLIAKIFKIRK